MDILSILSPVAFASPAFMVWPVGFVWPAVFLAGLVIFLMHRRRATEAVASLLDNFPRGGPPGPTHPLPSDDGGLLRRRTESGKRRLGP